MLKLNIRPVQILTLNIDPERSDLYTGHIFITPRSCFDNTLNFDITLMPNGCDCVVISLDIGFYASVTFRLHFSM